MTSLGCAGPRSAARREVKVQFARTCRLVTTDSGSSADRRVFRDNRRCGVSFPVVAKTLMSAAKHAATRIRLDHSVPARDTIRCRWRSPHKTRLRSATRESRRTQPRAQACRGRICPRRRYGIFLHGAGLNGSGSDAVRKSGMIRRIIWVNSHPLLVHPPEPAGISDR